MAYQVVDTQSKLKVMLGKLLDLPNDPPSFYLDAEGYQLGRFGTIDLLQLHVLPIRETFIIDVFVLKHAAFETSVGSISLKRVLESSAITKVFFDVRNDSDAIFEHYNVTLDGVVDLQIMEYLQAKRTGRHLLSLKTCMSNDSGLHVARVQDWSVIKDSITRSFTDGVNAVPISQQRPLSDALLRYAAGDVHYLPLLYRVYGKRLTKHAWQGVQVETQKRLRQSRSPTYDPQGKQKWKGPYRVPESGARQQPTNKLPNTTSRGDNRNQKKPQGGMKKPNDPKTPNKALQSSKPNQIMPTSRVDNVVPQMSNLSLAPNALRKNPQARDAILSETQTYMDIQQHLLIRQVVTTTTIPLRHNPVTFVKPEQVPGSTKKGKRKQKSSGGGAGARHSGDHDWLFDDLDWTLCDKDCGWCGHCYDGVYI